MSVIRMAKRLKVLRKQRGWTQSELAARTGLHRVFIAQLEGGTHDPSLTTLEKLARAFRMPLADFLGQGRPTAHQTETQALLALKATPGQWYCPRCWSVVAGIDDVHALGQLARTVIRASDEYERLTTDETTASCSRAGAPSCDFDRTGAKRRSPNTWNWMVRAKARDAGAKGRSTQRLRATAPPMTPTKG